MSRAGESAASSRHHRPVPAASQERGLHPGTFAFYERHADEYFAATAHLDARALYGPFLRELPPGARILDAGCGSGRDTRALIDLGYRVTAIDASPALAQRATALTGQPCAALSFQELTYEHEFDGIWACASLLHVAKQDVPAVMRRFARALVSGGVMYLSLREGDGECVDGDGRRYSDYTASAFRDATIAVPALSELACWITPDLRPGRTVRWLNFLFRNAEDRSQELEEASSF